MLSRGFDHIPKLTGSVPAARAHHWLTFSSAYYGLQVIYSIVILQVVRLQLVLLPGPFSSQVQGFVFSIVEFHKVFVGLF